MSVSLSLSVADLLFLLLVAAVCGAIVQALTGFGRGGLLAATAVGFIGALVGMWLQKETGLPEPITVEADGRRLPVVWSILGGVLFAAVVGLLTTPHRRRAYRY